MSSLRYSIQTPVHKRRLFSLGGVLKLLLFLAVLAVAAWLIFQQTVHKKLRGAIQEKILQQISPLGMGIAIGDAHFTEGKGLVLDDVDLHLATNQHGSPATVSNLQVAKLQIHSRSSLTDLATGALKPDAIEVHRANFQMIRGLDGRFDFTPIIAQLSQLSPGQTSFAPVLLRDSEIEIVSLDQSLPTITLSGINFTVSPVQHQGQSLLHVQGGFETDAVSQIQISLFINQQTKTWNAQLNCDGATISRNIVNSLPPSIASQFAQIQNLNGLLSFNATASGNDQLCLLYTSPSPRDRG